MHDDDYDLEDVEFGGLILTDDDDDEEGGPDDDDEDEWGGISPADLTEIGGRKKKKKKKKRGIRLFGKKKKKKSRSRGRGGAPNPCNVGGSLYAVPSADLHMGVPFTVLPRDISVLVPALPPTARLARPDAEMMVRQSSLWTAIEPIINTVNLGALGGAYALPLNAPVGRLVQVPAVIVDIGPQTLSTPAGGVVSMRITGQFIDGRPADLNEWQFELPNTTEKKRLIFWPFVYVNGRPVPKLLHIHNEYLTPYIGPSATQAADSAGDVEAPVALAPSVPTGLLIAGQAPPGVQITGSVLTPTHPFYETLLQNIRCKCA